MTKLIAAFRNFTKAPPPQKNVIGVIPVIRITRILGLSSNISLMKSRKIKVKVKVTLVQALRLCTGRTAHRGSRGIALLFHDQRH